MYYYIKNKYTRLAVFFCVAKFIVLAIALAYVDRFNSDMIENLYWGQEWQAGYYKHPPLFAWVSEAWVRLFQNKIIFYHFLTAFLFSFYSWLCFVLYKKIIGEIKALIGIVLLDGIVYSNFVNICVNANTVLFVIHPLVCLFAYNVITEDRKKMFNWLMFASFAGLAFLCKYSSGLVTLACGLTIIYSKRFKIFKEIYFYLAVVLFFVITVPHILWVANNDFLTIHYVKDMQPAEAHGFFYSRIFYTLELLGSVLLNFLPCLVGMVILLRPKEKLFSDVKISDNRSVFLILLSIVPFFAMTFIGGVMVKHQWLIAHVFMMPCLLLWFFDITEVKSRIILACSMVIGFFLLVSGYLIFVYKNSYKFSDTAYDIHISNQRLFYIDLARFIDKSWKERYGFDAVPKYICSNENIAGLVAIYSRDKNIFHVIPNCDLYVSRWIDAEDMFKNGLVVIHRNIPEKHFRQVEAKDLAVYHAFNKLDHLLTYNVDDLDHGKLFITFYKN